MYYCVSPIILGKLRSCRLYQVIFMEDTPVMVIDVFFIYPKSRQARRALQVLLRYIIEVFYYYS